MWHRHEPSGTARESLSPHPYAARSRRALTVNMLRSIRCIQATQASTVAPDAAWCQGAEEMTTDETIATSADFDDTTVYSQSCSPWLRYCSIIMVYVVHWYVGTVGSSAKDKARRAAWRVETTDAGAIPIRARRLRGAWVDVNISWMAL